MESRVRGADGARRVVAGEGAVSCWLETVQRSFYNRADSACLGGQGSGKLRQEEWKFECILGDLGTY